MRGRWMWLRVDHQVLGNLHQVINGDADVLNGAL
jgi:hypothetical protein